MSTRPPSTGSSVKPPPGRGIPRETARRLLALAYLAGRVEGLDEERAHEGAAEEAEQLRNIARDAREYAASVIR